MKEQEIDDLKNDLITLGTAYNWTDAVINATSLWLFQSHLRLNNCPHKISESALDYIQELETKIAELEALL